MIKKLVYIKYILVSFTALLAGAAIPISTAFQNISAGLFLIAFLLVPCTWDELKKISLQPFAIAGMALGVALISGTFWTTASQAAAWGFILKMRAYYLIPVFLLLLTKNKPRNFLLLGFAAATLLSVVLSCLAAWFETPIFKSVPGDWFIFRTHTYHNYFAALLSSGLLVLLLTNKINGYWKILTMFLILLISYDILFLVAGRTGQIIYLLMIGLVLFFWNKRLGLFLGLIIISMAIFVLPKYSTAINAGLNNTKSDMQAYSKGDSYSSVGLRLEWHKKSIELIKDKPIFGHGTGSFKIEYNKTLDSKNILLSSGNPHNDYLWLSVELGIIGGVLLLMLMLAAAWQGRHLDAAWKWTLYAMLTGMGVSTLANSFFTDNITGLAFVLLTCALLNGPKKLTNYHD